MLRKKLPPLPEASRFDRMGEPDLVVALEASLSGAIRMFDSSRQNPVDREPAMAHVERQLENSLAVARALRRKYATGMV